MMRKALQSDIDLWEAWIEFDHVAEHCFGTFYIIGEIKVPVKSRKPVFIKQMDPEIPGRVNLFLQSADGMRRLSEVIYAEPVTQLNQYRSVAIFADGEMIAEIANIEILV